MKQLLPVISAVCIITTSAVAQKDRFKDDFQAVRNELTAWDPIRGEWLSSSLESMTRKQAIPDRTFPEELTPMDMLRMVPLENRSAVQRIVTQNQQNTSDSTGRQEWNQLSSVLDRTNCKPVMGRTYGDPHLKSFDGATYSFQTVGEFVLAKSESSKMEIQARQQAQGDDFSLNTAVAMNVAGDRVCIYSNEKPDNNNSSALRVDGNVINISRNTYYLPHGGTINYSSNSYVVTWPTGETAKIEMRNSSRMNFMNISVQVYPCAINDLQGLLGNGNGRESDDFDVNNGVNRPVYMAFSSFGNDQLERASNEAEKEYLAFLARDYARGFRVTTTSSLFDYGFGQSTLSYTDESFPKVHRTLGDLNNDQQVAARKTCEDRGVTQDEMKGCIYDNAYLNIPPSPRPTFNDPTSGLVLGQVDKPVPNVNPDRISKQKLEKGDASNGTPEVQSLGKPSTQEVKKEKNVEQKNQNIPAKQTEPVFKPNNNPISKPENTTPIIKEKPSGTTIKPSSGGTTVKPSGGTPIKTAPTLKGKG